MPSFEFLAYFGPNRAPYRILGDGGIVLAIELDEADLEKATALVKAGRGKALRILIEVREPPVYAAPRDQDL